VIFEEGFTVITGETGAGKSILLEALGLVLGSRANFNAIRKGEEKSVVEAVFSYKDSWIDERLRKEGLDILDDLLIRRELTRTGRSRAFINDSPVALNVLNEITMRLVDMHGQQENLALQSAGYQLEQLDLFVKNKNLLEELRVIYHEYKTKSHELLLIREEAAQLRKDQDYFAFQLNEIEVLNPTAEDFQGLITERDTLAHAEEITRSLNDVSGMLSSDHSGIISSLQSAVQRLRSLQQYNSVLQELYARLESSKIELDDVLHEVERFLQGIDSNPTRLEFISERLDDYQRLMHKHNASTIDDLLNVKAEYSLKLEGINHFDEEINTLEKRIKALSESMDSIADQLHSKRESGVEAFGLALTEQVRKLGMPKAQIVMDLQRTNEINETGIDRLQIAFDANGNNHLVPLKESASGGEVARLMLGLKSIIAANDETPTLIFDEVDTGVSGEVAKQIGGLMRAISLNSQIIAVTHLPGVAARGHHHLKIKKHDDENGVFSELHVLTEQQRIEEIASMFSGAQLNDASLESAKSLLLGD
jgi:DNA repair protein RecN (Recombination protein N)